MRDIDCAEESVISTMKWPLSGFSRADLWWECLLESSITFRNKGESSVDRSS